MAPAAWLPVAVLLALGLSAEVSSSPTGNEDTNRDDRPTAAVVIGGVQFCSSGPCKERANAALSDAIKSTNGDPRAIGCDSLEPNILQRQSVEVYGCPAEVKAVMPDFPYPVTFTAGMWAEKLKVLIVCGGLDCFNVDSYGEAIDKCWFFDPLGKQEWEPFFDLRGGGKTAHILAKFDNGNDGNEEIIAFGGYANAGGSNYSTEILTTKGWTEFKTVHREMEFLNNGVTCLTHDYNRLYSVGKQIWMVDLNTWGLSHFGKTQSASGNVGFCAFGFNKAGQKGIYMRDGHWYNVVRRQWETVSPPPLPGPVGAYSMITFRDSPTIFGLPTCDDSQCRTGTGVLWYNVDEDRWDKLGDLQEDRLWHETVEVPASFCDAFIPTTTEEPGTPPEPEGTTSGVNPDVTTNDMMSSTEETGAAAGAAASAGLAVMFAVLAVMWS